MNFSYVLRIAPSNPIWSARPGSLDLPQSLLLGPPLFTYTKQSLGIVPQGTCEKHNPVTALGIYLIKIFEEINKHVNPVRVEAMDRMGSEKGKASSRAPWREV